MNKEKPKPIQLATTKYSCISQKFLDFAKWEKTYCSKNMEASSLMYLLPVCFKTHQSTSAVIFIYYFFFATFLPAIFHWNTLKTFDFCIMIKCKFWQQLLPLVILMQPCYLPRRAHAVHFSTPLQGGSSAHKALKTLLVIFQPKLQCCQTAKVSFLFLWANLIWKPPGLVNVRFHNVACTELLFRVELCFNS